MFNCKCGKLIIDFSHFDCNFEINKHQLKEKIDIIESRGKLLDEETYNSILKKIEPPIMKNKLFAYKESYNMIFRNYWIGRGLGIFLGINEDQLPESFESWTPPFSYDILKKMVSFIGDSKVLELAAGTALQARFLNMMGVDIIATDSYDELGDFTYMPVEKIDYKNALKKYGDTVDCLMIIWGRGLPDKETFKLFKGNKIIVIGEPYGGCTSAGIIDDICCYADKNDIDTSNLVDDNTDNDYDNELVDQWLNVDRIYFTQWFGINDYIQLIKRK